MLSLFKSFLLLFICCSICLADELIIEPDMGRTPILSAISHAKSSVDLVMYGFTDRELMRAFTQAKAAGKNVRILLEPHPYKNEDENESAISLFKSNSVNLKSTNPYFRLTHQKTLLLDQQVALVMTFNFTHSAFKKTRNFALVITDPVMLQEINSVFNADWQHENVHVKNPNLIWSPNNSREKLLSLIREAKAEIKIYAQDISDYQIIGALAKAARAGVKVKILMSVNAKKAASKQLAYLKKSGVTLHHCKNYYIHAKVMIIDDKRAVLGSINFTRASINNNRELAVITQDPKVINILIKTFNQDWGGTTILEKHEIKITPAQVSKFLKAIKKFYRYYNY